MPRIVPVSVIALLLTALSASPAIAHPFGPPPQAAVVAEGATVTVTWSAEPDDLFSLGQATGALAQRQTFVFDDGVPVDSDGAASIDEQIAAAPEIQDYLGSHILVRQDAAGCPLRDVSTELINDAGARLTYDCPEPVEAVELEVTALTDLDPAYRTVGLGAGGARTLHTSTEPVQLLSLIQGDDDTAGGFSVLGGVLTAAVVGAVGVVALRRRWWPARFRR